MSKRVKVEKREEWFASAVWLTVEDLDRSVRFYRDVLGLKLIDYYESASAHFDAGNIRLALHEGDFPKKSPFGGWLVLYSPKGIVKASELLSKRGLQFEDIERKAYGDVLWFTDPDNHVICLWEPPARGLESYEMMKRIMVHFESIIGRRFSGMLRESSTKKPVRAKDGRRTKK
jgi:catechol 2,3-dioxygenase-like lactoylglutathione lyase family enzyme